MKRFTLFVKVAVLTFFLGVISVLLWFSFQQPAKPLQSNVTLETAVSNDKIAIADVSFCQVASQPENYTGKIIRLKGVYSFELHGALIGDQNCSSVETQTWVKSNPQIRKELDTAIERVYGRKNRKPLANLTAVGKFEKNNPSNNSDTWESTAPYKFELVEIIAVEPHN